MASVTKEVRHCLLYMANDIAEDLEGVSEQDKHTDEYRATKEIVTALRRTAGEYRYKKLLK